MYLSYLHMAWTPVHDGQMQEAKDMEGLLASLVEITRLRCGLLRGTQILHRLELGRGQQVAK